MPEIGKICKKNTVFCPIELIKIISVSHSFVIDKFFFCRKKLVIVRHRDFKNKYVSIFQFYIKQKTNLKLCVVELLVNWKNPRDTGENYRLLHVSIVKNLRETDKQQIKNHNDSYTNNK